jgi:amino acid transporter
MAGDASGPDLSSPGERRPIGAWALFGVSVTSLGGPLALAALYAPSIAADASGSAGLVVVAATVVFGLPLAIWMRYSRHISASGGLYSFVEAAAGRRIALVQAGLWIISYLLYLLFTTGSIVYDTLPVVLPGIGPYQPFLEIAIPVALAAVMLAGRTATLVVIGAIAAGQMVLVAALAVVAVGHDAPVSSFGFAAPGGPLLTATGQISLLYICGSLPLFLGGEVARPRRTMRRALVGGCLLTAAGILAVDFPLAANPAFTRAPIPGMSVAKVFSGHPLAVAVGLGVVVSIAGVMLVEFLALSRLMTAVSTLSLRVIVPVIAAVLVATAFISLIDPEEFYEDLIKPSLIALWLSQLIAFAVYPRFASRVGERRTTAWALAAGASVFALYGIWATLHHAVS